jgi:hypothetical protein
MKGIKDMKRLTDYFDDRDMFDYTVNDDGSVTVTTPHKNFHIREGAEGVYIVTDQDGKEKVFYPSEMETTDYIITEMNRADDRDIFYREVKRFLLVGYDRRSIIGSFDTEDEAQARADEINGYAAEDGDEPTEFKIIDFDE